MRVCKVSRVLCLVICAALSALYTPVAQAEVVWKLAPGRTSIKFSVSHFLLSRVRGKFKKYSGKIVTPSVDNFRDAKVEAAIEIKSVDTGNADRDAHLQEEVFFHASKFPQMKFKSTKVRHLGGDKYAMRGLISIRGVSKSIDMDVKFVGKKDLKNGRSLCTFKAVGELDRTEFGIHWNSFSDAGGIVVGDTVEIEISAALLEIQEA